MSNDPKDMRLDWALGETLGRESPPDLAAATVERWRRGEASALPANGPRSTSWRTSIGWLLAAAVVFAFAWLAQPETTDGREALVQDPATGTERMPTVTSRAEVDALPEGSLGVVGVGLDDDAVRGLVRLRRLRWLELRYPEALTLGLGLKTPPPENPACVTGAAFEILGSLSQLRTLRLVGAWGLTESFPPDATSRAAIAQSTIGQFERLPLLRELALSSFDVPAWALEPLPRLPSLRELDLSANYGVDADAVAILVRCERLERLDLHACMTLEGAAIAKLAGLPALADLDVGDLDGLGWRSGIRPFLGPVAKQSEQEAHAAFGARVVGVTDMALAGLANAKSLRRLRMTQPRCTMAGMKHLDTFPLLVDLDVFGFGSEPARPDELADFLPQLEKLAACGAFGDAFCRALRAKQTKLRSLELPACYAITDAGLAELLAIPTLRDLDVRQSRGLTAAAMPLLERAVHLERLDLRHVDWVTKEHEQKLRAALPNLKSLRTSASD